MRVTRLLFPGERRGYHWGRQLQDLRTAAIFDATPHTLRSLYAAEWLQAACERLVQDDWPYLHSLLSVIGAAEAGSPIPDLAQQLPPEQGRVGEAVGALRRYLYGCAKHGYREYASIRDLVRISVGHDQDWLQAADFVEAEYGLAHPAKGERNLDQFFISEAQQEALVAYFYLYATGFDHAHEKDVIQRHWESAKRAIGYITRRQRTLLQATNHADLVRDAFLFIPADRKRSAALVDRYHVLCAALGVEFWKDADVKLSKQSDWDKQLPFIKWLGAETGLLATLAEPLCKHYLRKYRELNGASIGSSSSSRPRASWVAAGMSSAPRSSNSRSRDS